MDYIIEKNDTQPEYVQPEPEQAYVVKHFKTAIDVEGKEVQVVDENRVERITVKQLEAQKLSYQNAIKEIDAKLTTIKGL